LGVGLAASRGPDEEKALGDAYNRIRSGSRRLDDSRRTLLESEELGLNVMCDLQGQRETILRTKGHLNDVDGNLDVSKKILNGLLSRMQSNNAMVWGLAIVLFIILVFVIYLKIQKVMATLR
ncbi:unnamed protein product, partial [Polarella glacialis]